MTSIDEAAQLAAFEALTAGTAADPNAPAASSGPSAPAIVE